MRVTNYIYQELQKRFPDLFVPGVKEKVTSALYAEFLPSAALADPNANPWGQYGNLEIPLKRKTIIISLGNTKNLPFSKIKEIDSVLRFLKRAGFSVLISVGDELEQYDNQLFDYEKMIFAGNKTRAEIQKISLSRGVPADELFFIDDLKIESSPDCILLLKNFFEHIESQKDVQQNSYTALINRNSQPSLHDEIGIIDIRDIFPFAKNSLDFKKTFAWKDAMLNKDLELEFEKNISKVSLLNDAGVSFLDIIALGPILRAEVFQEIEKILALIEKGISFFDLISLDSTLRSEIYREYNAIFSGFSFIGIFDQEVSHEKFQEYPLIIKLITAINENRKKRCEKRFKNLYSVSIRNKPSEDQRAILISHIPFLEEVILEKLEYFPTLLQKGNCFENLVSLSCGSFFGELEIDAPKLAKLIIWTDKKDFQIHLEKFPFLNQLSISFMHSADTDLEKKQPVLSCVENKNLKEVSIIGNVSSIAFIETLLLNSPNLNHLMLSHTRISEDDLEILSKRFPNVQIEVEGQLRTNSPVGAASTRAPNKVYQSAGASVEVGQREYQKNTRQAPSEGIEISLKNCLEEVFSWGGVACVRESSGKLKIFPNEKAAQQALGSSWRHEFLYDKYKLLLELQTVLEQAIKKISHDKFDYSAFDDILFQLHTIKSCLEENHQDYKMGIFKKTKTKTKTKKDFYERVTNSIANVQNHRNNLKLAQTKKSVVVCASSNTNYLRSDFDTKHDAETKFTMKEACVHLSLNQSQRFSYTRDGVYTLDLKKNTLFSPVHSHVESVYIVPLSQRRQSTDDWYEFKQKIDLTIGDSYRISSLSSHDILLQLTLDGRPLTDSHVQIIKNELGFYTLKALVRLQGELGYILNVARVEKNFSHGLPVELQAIISNLQSFPSKEVDELKVSPKATVDEKLEAMYEQKKGACRHRAAIFLHKLNKLKAKDLKSYANIEARAVDRGGVHVDIEVSIDGGKSFEVLDLGGYDAREQYVSNKLPALQFSSKQKKDAVKPDFADVLNQIDQGLGKNIFLCLTRSSDIRVCLSQVRKKSSLRPIFYVDNPNQLRTSLKNLKLDSSRTHCQISNPPTGLLHDFLMTHQLSDPAPIIVINWENFTLSEIVQFNSVIDFKNRRVDNTPIPVNATIVGLHSRNEQVTDLLGDASFISRHASGGVFDFTSTPLTPTLETSKSSPSLSTGDNVLKINLHHSARWQELLIGKAFVDGSQLRWQDGELVKLIPPSSISSIDIINPPINDPTFYDFVADLRAGLPLTFLNHMVSIGRTINVSVSEKKEFPSDVSLTVRYTDSIVKDAFVINSSTFEQCLHSKKITENGLLLAEKGLIESHANGKLRLCLCDNLNDSQWSLLLDGAKKFNVALELIITKNVTIPPFIDYTLNDTLLPDTQEKSPNQFIVSDDVEYSVSKLQCELPVTPIVIDLSELTPDDLFFKIEHSISDAGFVFKKKMSAVWQALDQGGVVILKGRCSEEILNYLPTLLSPNPYFYIEGIKHFFSGRLIIVADEKTKVPPWLSIEKQKISKREKRNFLGLPQDTESINKPFIQLLLERAALSQDRLAVYPVNSGTASFNLGESILEQNLSLSSCEIFEKNRLEAVKHVLSYSPFVLLEGRPGVGKSYFIRSLEADPSFKFYREDQIEEWATDVVPLGVKKILFRDEINLRSTDCSQDRDLLNNPPSIFVHGKYYRLDHNCKIMYAQNPVSYGGERYEPTLFQDLPNCKIHFEQMSPSFVLHRILKPIYETTFSAAESEKRAKKTIEACFASMRSIRALQTKAIFECALHRNPLPPTPPMDTKEICFGLSDFILTTSRFEPYRDVLTLLQARVFKRQLPESTTLDGARFNGVNGLILQGPPGAGKSEFIESILKNEGYIEISHDTLQSDIENGKVYYRLRASVSNEEKLSILHKAFQQGAILVIDEIDSCPLLEDYLNAYLVGEDIYGKRPEKPGFTILSTANGAGMKGRRVLPEPLQSRLLKLEFNEYPRADLVAILRAKFVLPGEYHPQLKFDMIAFLVDAFLAEQNTNRETPPTFRDLYVVSQDYFENKFAYYNRLGLSKEQHEFMLVYRSHPKLTQFTKRIESLEFKVSDMTLDDFDQLLKTTGQKPTLFGGKDSSLSQKKDPRSDLDEKSFR